MDLNPEQFLLLVSFAGRSPLGLRGFKFIGTKLLPFFTFVAAHSGCVDLNILSDCCHNLLSCRSPLGLRGFKLSKGCLPPRQLSRSPLGLRGFKLPARKNLPLRQSRSPLGLRGFKYCKRPAFQLQYPVAAHSGCVDLNIFSMANSFIISVAAHSGCVDLNNDIMWYSIYYLQSQPTRAAWI